MLTKEEKNYTYQLPNDNNVPVLNTTKNNSLIIIGANGSGKSKLGEWMEKNNLNNVHRIGAQRSLVFGDYIIQKSYEQATNLLTFGYEQPQPTHNARWNHQNYTSTLLNDYENVLSALIALKNNQQEEYLNDCKKRESEGKCHTPVPDTVIDVFKRIWKSIFPQRNINFDDAKVTASYEINNQSQNYRGRDMSDGERVALYLIAQSLVIPKNKTIIIDEPEIHLHRSIMNRLWTAIENERKDCFFIYITHDTQFAANHKQSKKIWVKNFNGKSWEIIEVNDNSLPEELLLNILGNRKPVLFVEGTADSYDTKLYSEIYKEYYVIPCGSCINIINSTKAMKQNSHLHHLICYGLIDIDFRTEEEIYSLLKNGIYTIDVAEIENLFLVEELLITVNKILGFNDNDNVDKIKHYVSDIFSKQITRQICAAITSELKYRLSAIAIEGKNDSEVQQSFINAYNNIKFNDIKNNKEKSFHAILKSNDYKKILKIFNFKGLSLSIGKFFELQNKNYPEFVIRQLQGTSSENIKKAIKKYLPDFDSER